MDATSKWAMYVDGYNFYYAVKKRLGDKQLYLGWCDFRKVALEIIDGRGTLSRVKYFTSPVENLGAEGGERGSERDRQNVWLRALSTVPQLEVVEGFYTGNHSEDPSRRHKHRSEKETDVNIAIALVLDAAKRVYDRAILVGGDYDQLPTVRAVTEEFMRPVEVWLPPGQQKGRWAEFDHNSLVSVQSLSTNVLERCRLPDTIHHATGLIEAPSIWRAR